MRNMRDPSGRLLTLLSLLQTPRPWPGTELARRLGVTPRTVRRDIERLRDLGYPVLAARGNTGGYRLTAGTAMPPLLLDDEEAVAIAIGLRTAGAVTGIEDTARRALAKLEQVLPHRLRHRVTALTRAAAALPPPDGAPPPAAPQILAALADACLTGENVRFTYTAADGRRTRRLAQPHHLVTAARRWYLLAHDEDPHRQDRQDRTAWRTFRVDRITAVHRTGARAPRRTLPGGADPLDWAMDALAGGSGTVRARLLLHAPIDQAAPQITAWHGVLEPAGEHTCVLHTRGDSLRHLAHRVVVLPVDYTLLDPPELGDHLTAIAARAARAVQGP